jgi:hypothetical protein
MTTAFPLVTRRRRLAAYNAVQFPFKALNVFPDRDNAFELLKRQIGQRVRLRDNPVMADWVLSQANDRIDFAINSEAYRRRFAARRGTCSREAVPLLP